MFELLAGLAVELGDGIVEAAELVEQHQQGAALGKRLVARKKRQTSGDVGDRRFEAAQIDRLFEGGALLPGADMGAGVGDQAFDFGGLIQISFSTVASSRSLR